MENFKKNFITVQISQNSKILLKNLEICYIIYMMFIKCYALMNFILAYLTKGNDFFRELAGNSGWFHEGLKCYDKRKMVTIFSNGKFI